MNRSPIIQFVSAGLFHPKKRDHGLARRQLYLNYGALTLATQLHLSGYKTSLRHGDHEDPEVFVERLFADGRLPSQWPLMVSMSSFYALPWTRAFCSSVRRRDAEARIVVGGRWVVGPDPHWLHSRLPEADLVVPGLGEFAIWSALGETPSGEVGKNPYVLPSFGLCHRLVDDFQRYQPSIETSRGCGMGCAFCEERDIALSKLREPNRIADILADAAAEYDNGEIHPYFQSSFFLPNARWATDLARAMQRRELYIPWRCETRVDGMKPGTVSALAASGMKVIDLGLETASPSQIHAMRKARDAERYLGAASNLLKACAANGVWVKVNVLLYGGETIESLEETQAWLDSHAKYIKGVSVGPVVAYGPPAGVQPFLSDLAQLGASPVDPESAATTGVTQLHLSSEIDAAEAERLSIAISRRYMDANDYFDLKSFSYYPRGFRRADFDRDVAASTAERLPFCPILSASATAS